MKLKTKCEAKTSFVLHFMDINLNEVEKIKVLFGFWSTNNQWIEHPSFWKLFRTVIRDMRDSESYYKKHSIFDKKRSKH